MGRKNLALSTRHDGKVKFAGCRVIVFLLGSILPRLKLIIIYLFSFCLRLVWKGGFLPSPGCDRYPYFTNR